MKNQSQTDRQPARSKVVVIGGGIGGLTCAHACIDAGLEVELYERRSLDAMLSGPGGIFIQRNALRVYDLLANGALCNSLYERGGRILAGGFFSQTGEPLYINLPQFAREQDLGVCLLRPELQAILYESLPEGTVRPAHTLVNFEEIQDQVQATFQDGSTAEGDILVGADGLYSKVRAGLHQDQPEEPIYSGMCCWRGWFYRADLPLSDRYSWAEFWGQGTRFGYFDVGGGRFGFYAFGNVPAGGDDDAAGGSLNVLRSRFANYADPVPAIIASLKDQPIYRDDIFDRNPLGTQWGKGRVTLIGDAAHPVQPNLGQGGCMAIEDGFELAKLLRSGGTYRNDVSLLLRQFEQSRRDRVTRVFNTSRQVGQLGQADTALGCFLRNWIYKLTPTWLADQQFKWLFDYRPSW